MEFKQYRGTQIAEMRPVTDEEAETKIFFNKVSVSDVDLAAGSPKKGDMVARNPKNHDDQWLVAEQYFKDNFEPMDKTTREQAPQKHVRFCPDNCHHLNITEKEQNEKGTKEHPIHVCKKFERRLSHGHYHPNLIRLDECYYDAHWENNHESKR